MKKLYSLITALIFVSVAMAQATPREKTEIKNDLVRERSKRIDATKDYLRGNRSEAKADHREAVVYHRAAVNKTNQIHRRDVQQRRRRHHRVVRHHRRYHRGHHVVVVRR